MLNLRSLAARQARRIGDGRRLRLAWALPAAFLLLVSLGAWAAAFLVLPQRVLPEVSVAGVTELSPQTPLTLSLATVGVTVANLTLHEVQYGPTGQVVAERAVPVNLVPVEEQLGLRKTLRLVAEDGANPLRHDAGYQLRLETVSKVLAFPLPQDVSTVYEYPIGTLRTPQLLPVEGVTQLRYGEPVPLNWSLPITDVKVTVTPALEVQTRIDAVRPDLVYVDLQNPAPGTRYEVTAVEAHATNGASLLSPASVAVETPALPVPNVAEARLVEGSRIVLPWSEDVHSFTYEIVPAVESTVSIDPDNPRLATISLIKAAQNKKYTVKMTGATSTRGAPLAEPQQLSIVTPAPLTVKKVMPVNSAFGVKRSSPISVTFSEPVLDRAAAQRAIAISPAVPGQFTWPEPNRVEFRANGPLPELTRIGVEIAGGPSGVRTANWGYMDKTHSFAFRTQPDKLIDVDLSRQVMTLYQGGKPVWSSLVATGVARAETPTGTFLVQTKLPSTRMRGVTPSGFRYDIWGVPWVLPFLGDYTIHGAPWRQLFGVPQSNGCVSMPTEAARFVYDWAPVGTPISIHY